MKQRFVLGVATVVFLFVVGVNGSLAEECDPATNDFCDCQTNSDCIDSGNSMMAGICGPANNCDNKFSPWVPRITGLGGFCGAYVNGCQKASITLSKDGKQVQVSITGPGAFTAEHCSLEVSVGDSAVESGSAAQIGDTVRTCTHNAPIYFYETMKTALEKGHPHCCGFDWSYRPRNRASR